MKHVVWVFLAAIVFAALGCLSSHDPIEEEEVYLAQVEQEGDKIFIIDQLGKRWEVTHAVNEYGFVAGEFEFGLGKDAIRPILNPQHLEPGDEGYPPDDGDFFVMGANLKYRPRAYDMRNMAIHEIVNDDYFGIKVAVAF